MKILVFTNYDSLRFIRNERERKGINLIENHSIIGFDDVLDAFTKDFGNKSLIVIQDEIPVDDPEFSRLLDINKDERVLILKHNKTSQDILDVFSNKFTLHGRNETKQTGLHYPVVFEIILDDKGDKYERIKSVVFGDADRIVSTEETLEILHNCLHPKTASTADTSILDDSQKDLVQKLIEIRDNFSSDYIKILTKLRISLLRS